MRRCTRKPSSLVVCPLTKAAVASPERFSAAVASESARSQDTSRR